jgi:hypothetical protein
MSSKRAGTEPAVRRLPAATLLVLLAGCQAETATVLFVQVTGKPGVFDPTTLEVTFEQPGYQKPTLFSQPGQTIALPTSFVVRADGFDGVATVEVTAKDAADRNLGEGKGTATLVPNERVDLTVELYPSDFPANERYQTNQLFSTTASGRQVGSDGNGSLVAVWEDSCPLNRCDVYYRMWDSAGEAKLNGVTNKTEEHVANDGNAYYDMPAVAMQPDGHFIIAWFRRDSQASPQTEEIRSRAFLPNGRPDDQSDSGLEITLDGADGTSLGTPAIAALKDRNYVVVWHQIKNATQWQVLARFLGPHGRPTKTNSGLNTPFEVANFPYASDKPEPWPAVAAGENKGFMVAWRQQGKLWARTYGEGAAPNAPAFSISATGVVQGFSVGPMRAGYAAIWADEASCDADASGSCIRFRRYSLVGAALESAFTLNTTTAGDQDDPAVAMRADGSLFAVWTSANDATLDPTGAVRGRRILSIGLPVGDDFQINTTTPKAQERPSVAMHNQQSFAVFFRDWSETGPDTDGAAIRGRLLYPDFGPWDGQVGALCDNAHPCKSGLACVDSQVSKRCHATCQSSADPCPAGGTCRPLTAGGQVCMY